MVAVVDYTRYILLLAFRAMTLNLDSARSLCLLRLSAIGDVCHAVAMVQAIQRQYPQLRITWVIGKVEYQLLRHLEGIDFVVFDKSLGWRSYWQLKQALSGQRFDVLLHMQVALRATIASMMISAKTRVGFDRARAKEGQWLVTNHHVEPLATPHVLEGFMGFAKAIGVQDLTPTWDIPVPASDSEFAANVVGNDKVMIICAAASKAERNWLPERYAAIADHAATLGFRVLLCGGPSELELNLATQIAGNSQSAIENWVGKTSLTQLLALLGQAKLVVAPDTGPAHMAVTQNTAVIGLYAHSNPGRTGPYTSLDYVVNVYPQAIAQQFNASVPWGTRAKGADLMKMISIDMVKAQIDRISHQQALL